MPGDEPDDESGEEADETTPLIPPESPRFRRSSHYGGAQEFDGNARKADWAQLMKEAESLDTDVLINVVSIEERRMQDKPSDSKVPFLRKSKRRGLIKWMFNALIGITVGLTAFFVEFSIESITEWRLERMWAAAQSARAAGDCAPWGYETPSGQRAGLGCLLSPAFAVHGATSLGCVLATAWMLVKYGPAAAGSGVSLVMAYLNGLHVPKLLSAKTLVCKVVGTILTVRRPSRMQHPALVSAGLTRASRLWAGGVGPSVGAGGAARPHRGRGSVLLHEAALLPPLRAADRRRHAEQV